MDDPLPSNRLLFSHMYNGNFQMSRFQLGFDSMRLMVLNITCTLTNIFMSYSGSNSVPNKLFRIYVNIMVLWPCYWKMESVTYFGGGR